MGSFLLQEEQHWKSYTGQDLEMKDLVHVFKFDVSSIFPRISNMDILSYKETDKAARFFQQRDRERYIVSKYCLRLLLSRFINLPAKEIEYSYIGNKKPIVNYPIHFNVSHHQKHVVIAISDKPVGIDIELYKTDFDYTNLLPSCFSDDEAAFIKSSENLHLNFYILWTRKEALLKASGEGIVNNLPEVNALNSIQLRLGQEYQLDSWFNKDQTVISLAKLSTSKPTQFWIVDPGSISV